MTQTQTQYALIEAAYVGGRNSGDWEYTPVGVYPTVEAAQAAAGDGLTWYPRQGDNPGLRGYTPCDCRECRGERVDDIYPCPQHGYIIEPVVAAHA